MEKEPIHKGITPSPTTTTINQKPIETITPKSKAIYNLINHNPFATLNPTQPNPGTQFKKLTISEFKPAKTRGTQLELWPEQT